MADGCLWTSCGCYCGSLARQVVSVVVVAASMLHVGMMLGWPATLPSLQTDTTISFNVTEYDVRLLVSCVGLSGIFSSLLVAPLVALIGYRHLMTVVLLPVIASWFLQALTPSLGLLYLGRVIGGMGFMTFSTITNPLMAELLEPRYRGFLGCLTDIVTSIGMLLAYLMAEFMNWRMVTLMCALPFVPLLLLSLNVPESPYWYVRSGRMRQAEEALVTLRGPLCWHSAQEELIEIQNSIREQPQASLTEQVLLTTKTHNFRPLLLMMAIIVLRELGGQFAIFSYAVYFFRSAGVTLNAFTCTVLVGLARLLSSTACAFVLDRVGRRFILTAAGCCCAISSIIGSVFLLWDIPGSSWVPLVAILAFVLGYGFGVGPVPWILLGELLPTPIRAVGSSLCITLYATLQVIIGLSFPQLVEEIGLGGSLLFFAAFNFILVVVIRRFLPETALSSLHHLEYAFRNSQSTNSSRKQDDVMSSQQPLLC